MYTYIKYYIGYWLHLVTLSWLEGNPCVLETLIANSWGSSWLWRSTAYRARPWKSEKSYDVHMGVSKTRFFPPKSSILIGFSIINHPFWGTPILGKYDIMNWGWNVTPIQLTNSNRCTFGLHFSPTLPPQPSAFLWRYNPWWSVFRSRHTFIKWAAEDIQMTTPGKSYCENIVEIMPYHAIVHQPEN